MFGAGWRNSYETGTALAAYAVKKTKKAVEAYVIILSDNFFSFVNYYYFRSEDSRENLAKVAEMFKEGLCSLHPRAYRELKSISMESVNSLPIEGPLYNLPYRRKVPSFGGTNFNGADPFDSFANSLTITRNDFHNFIHLDRDLISVAYGWWWAARYDQSKGRYVLDEAYDHNKIKGGAFLWAGYKAGVDFQRYA